VSDSSVKVVKLMEEIAAASQEQSEGIEQVNKAVTEMNRVTQQNAASAEEMASIMALFKTNHQSSRRVSPLKVYEKVSSGKAVVKSGRFLPSPPP
jgi:methyl-accepting chemotaxis protein